MALLTDSVLKALIAAGDIIIDPFTEDHLTPNGYDLTITEVAIPVIELQALARTQRQASVRPDQDQDQARSRKRPLQRAITRPAVTAADETYLRLEGAHYALDEDYRVSSGTALIPPQTRFAVSTLERVGGGKGHGAMLWLRTSWARRGVVAAFGFIDAGFQGTLTLAAFNGSRQFLEVPIGQTFAQAVFVGMEGEAEQLYAQRSGNYQGQQGVTWAGEAKE